MFEQRHLSVMAQVNIKNNVRSEYVKSTDFVKKYSDIWGISSYGGRKDDKRTAQQIIDDTTKAMGIKVIKRRH